MGLRETVLHINSIFKFGTSLNIVYIFSVSAKKENRYDRFLYHVWFSFINRVICF